MVRLGDVFKITSGGTPEKKKIEYYQDGTIPWVKTGDLKGMYVTNNVECITELGLKNSSAKVFPRGTVLLAMYGATIGACSILSYDASTNQACAAFLPSDKFLPEYLYYLLTSKKENFIKDGVGGAQPNISAGYLKDVEIEQVSIEAQKEIVSSLSKVEIIIANRQQQLQKLDELVKARFVEMFGDLKFNDKKWEILKFFSFAKIDTEMTNDFQKYAEYPHIGIDSIEKNTGILRGYRTVAEDGVVSGKYLFTDKHIIYSKIRPNLNKVAMPTFAGVCSADAYPILPLEGHCNREFLVYVMRSTFYLDYILSFSDRTNLPKVNKQQVEGFSCPIPPIELQEKFKEFVQQIDKSKSRVQQSLEKLEMLKKSLMQKYFG